jgi:hypothetical protein
MDISSQPLPVDHTLPDALGFQNIAVRIAAGGEPVPVEHLPKLENATPTDRFIQGEAGSIEPAVMVNPGHESFVANPVVQVYAQTYPLESNYQAYNQRYGTALEIPMHINEFNEFTGNALTVLSEPQMKYLDESHFNPRLLTSNLVGETTGDGYSSLNMDLRLPGNKIAEIKQAGLHALTTQSPEAAGAQFNLAQRPSRNLQQLLSMAGDEQIPFLPAELQPLSPQNAARTVQTVNDFYKTSSELRKEFMDLNPDYATPAFRDAMDENIGETYDYPAELTRIVDENNRRAQEDE